MNVNELAAPQGESFKFTEIGDTVEGVIVYVGDWTEQINKSNGKPETVAKIGLEVAGEITYVWPRKGSAMAQAIAEALREANLGELSEGQTLKLRFDSTKDTGKPQPLKLFRARVTEGEPQPKPDSDPF